jgi:drug/metabolite transporter (DMT)-like permease
MVDGHASGAGRGALLGLLAAASFGASAPLCKLLLPGAPAPVLAGLLYAGAASALSLYRLLQPQRPGTVEAPLSRRDGPALLAIILLGGVVGPLLMLAGLARTTAVAGALLLNLEGPFTAALAVLLFREHMGRRAAQATLLVLVGAALLAAGPESGAAAAGVGAGAGRSWMGAAALAGACLSWAVDNNLTQRLSLRDPVALVRAKALGAAVSNLGIAAVLGYHLPQARVAAAALGVGAVSYGASVLLDAYALRLLGAVREAAYFATAPFVGAALGAILFRQGLGGRELGAGALMAAGVLVLLRERHSHVHTHEALVHDHAHVHDEHHRHAHEGPVEEPHAHLHQHDPTTHAHPHVPDAHHRHKH